MSKGEFRDPLDKSKSPSICIRLPNDYIGRLDKMAFAMNMRRSTYIRKILMDFLDAEYLGFRDAVKGVRKYEKRETAKRR